MNVPISVLVQRKGSVVHSIAPSLSIFDAVAEMNRLRIGAIVILDAGKLAGIFTERDALTRVIAASLDPKTTPLARVMTPHVLTVGPEATVQQVMDIFAEKRCRHLPVIKNDKLVGLISIGDVSRWVANAHRAEAESLRQYIAGGLST
jgi:CBS domain-containing protein